MGTLTRSRVLKLGLAAGAMLTLPLGACSFSDDEVGRLLRSSARLPEPARAAGARPRPGAAATGLRPGSVVEGIHGVVEVSAAGPDKSAAAEPRRQPIYFVEKVRPRSLVAGQLRHQHIGLSISF